VCDCFCFGPVTGAQSNGAEFEGFFLFFFLIFFIRTKREFPFFIFLKFDLFAVFPLTFSVFAFIYFEAVFFCQKLAGKYQHCHAKENSSGKQE